MSEPPEFAVVVSLLALVSDAPGCGKRLAELRQALEKTEAATAKLATDREQHATAVAAAKAEHNARAAALVKRETDLVSREGMCAHQSQLIAKWKAAHSFPNDPNLGPGGRSHSGLTREVGHG
jgi:hypothetical protein